jgi:hypothetical protein
MSPIHAWIFGIGILALWSQAAAQTCVTDFDCASSSTPVCDSGTCVAGSSACTSDDAGEDADDGPAGARPLDAVPGVAAGMTAAVCGVPASEADYYKTTASSGVPLTATLSWSGSDVLGIAAFDGTGTLLGSSQGLSPQAVTVSRPDGTYYLRVMNATVPASSEATPYAISVSEAGDLFGHNGFEACWSKATTIPDFLTALTNSVEGVPGCIPAEPNASYPICATISGSQPMCAGGVPGCPITLRSKGPSSNIQDPLVAEGLSHFQSSATVDPFSMPIVIFSTQCTATVTNTDPSSQQVVSIDYSIDFNVQADGNGGAYVASVNGIPGVSVNNLTSGDVVISGDFVCTAFPAPVSVIAAALAKAIPTAVPDAQVGATVGNSICPLQ